MVEVKYNTKHNCWTIWIDGEENIFLSYKSENEALYMKGMLEAASSI